MIKKYKSVAVYARVSTNKQKVDMQLQELNDFIKHFEWKLYKRYIDHGYTGANTKRPMRPMGDSVHSYNTFLRYINPLFGKKGLGSRCREVLQREVEIF